MYQSATFWFLWFFICHSYIAISNFHISNIVKQAFIVAWVLDEKNMVSHFQQQKSN